MAEMQLIDTHCHLDDEQFGADRDVVIERAEAAGVAAIIAVGITLESSRRAVGLAERHGAVWAAVGIHPNWVAQAQPGDWDGILSLAEHPRVVAIGETGLDRFRDHAPLGLQLEWFRRHLELAQQRGLAIIIHCRQAESETLGCLTRFCGPSPAGGASPAAVAGSQTAAAAVPAALDQSPGPAAAGLRGVMHAFSSQPQMARRGIELGLHVSFAGQITYHNRKFQPLRELAALLPPDRLLIETDSPYLSPEPHRGKRNEPARLVHTAECLSRLLDLPLPELAAVTSRNARALFGIAGPG